MTDAYRQTYGNNAFSHSDSLGIFGLYSAVWTGMEAESEIRLLLEDPAPTQKT